MNKKICGVSVAECQLPRSHGVPTAAPEVRGAVIPILEIRKDAAADRKARMPARISENRQVIKPTPGALSTHPVR